MINSVGVTVVSGVSKAGHHVRTPRHDFHCLGNRHAGVTDTSCPRLNMQSSWVPVVKKQASLQQDTCPDTEYSYSQALFLPELHHVNFLYTDPNSHVPPELPRALCKPSEFTCAACVTQHEFVRASQHEFVPSTPRAQPTLRECAWSIW